MQQREELNYSFNTNNNINKRHFKYLSKIAITLKELSNVFGFMMLWISFGLSEYKDLRYSQPARTVGKHEIYRK
jgi:hypothetical protein